MTDQQKMTPYQRYENMRDLSEGFKHKGVLKNLILKHLQETIDQARKEGFELARKMALDIAKDSSLPNFQRVSRMEDLRPEMDYYSKPSTTNQPPREVQPAPIEENPLHGPGSGCHCTACETWEA